MTTHLRVEQPIETAHANYLGRVKSWEHAYDPGSWVHAGGAHVDGPMNLCGETGDGTTDPHKATCGLCLMAIEQLVPLGLLGIGRSKKGDECISSLMHEAFPWAPALVTFREVTNYDVGYDHQPDVQTQLAATDAPEYRPSWSADDVFFELGDRVRVGDTAGYLITGITPP